jgi:uncharacterized protein YndB with AHSA1/START domain
MPVKKDASGKRWVEMQLLVPGTPEQVWQAMATGPGNTAWFTRTRIEERVGGSVQFQFGPDMGSSGEVTQWQPPNSFGYVERDWMPGAPPVATEITIEARNGGQCVVRMVHSLFASTDDWDDQLESFESGWPGFFEVLRIYLSKFAGRTAASFQVMVTAKGELPALWKRFTQALRIAGLDVGDAVVAQAPPEELTGIVERVQQDRKIRVIMLSVTAPFEGTVMCGTYGTQDQVNLSISTFIYGDQAEALGAAAEPKWRNWMQATFNAASR